MSRFMTVAAEQIADLAERSAESGRLTRGRTLFRKGSVSDLLIAEGSVVASVRGGDGDLYETTIATSPAPRHVAREIAQALNSESHRTVDDLIGDGLDVCPGEIDLAFTCDCADWEEPCKHVVALFLAFADRVDLDEAELLRWRGVDLTEPTNDEAEVSPRPRSPRRPKVELEPRATAKSAPAHPTDPADPADPMETSEQVDRTARLSELQSLLGDTAMRPSTTDDAELERPASTTAPAFAEYLGVGRSIDPVDLSGIAAPDPLFAEMQLGPLADLGPELAAAVATIIARLDDVSTERSSTAD